VLPSGLVARDAVECGTDVVFAVERRGDCSEKGKDVFGRLGGWPGLVAAREPVNPGTDAVFAVEPGGKCGEEGKDNVFDM